MTDHVKCPECGIECVAIAWGELWRGGCPEHYLGPPRSDTDLALVEVGRILRPYWRECEAADMAAKHRIGPEPWVEVTGAGFAKLKKRIAHLEARAEEQRQWFDELQQRVVALDDDNRMTAVERRLAALDGGIDYPMTVIKHARRLKALEHRVAALERDDPAEPHHACHNCGKALRADAMLPCGITGQEGNPFSTCDSWEPEVPAAEPPDSPTVKDATPPIRLRVRYGCPSALVVPAPRR